MNARAGLCLVLCACGGTPGHLPKDASVDDAGSTEVPDAGSEPPDASFGSKYTGDATTFRVWAPAATAASVELGPSGRTPMTAEESGVFSATISGVQPGDTYRYVLETPNGTLTRLDPYCRQLTPDRTSCTVIDPGAYGWMATSFSRAPREALVIYELHVGSFAVPTGAPGGTLTSARAKLADLADLGINAVELMPVHAFGGGATSWGYNPQLYFAPKPSYGTADELRAFVDEAHRLGIAVLIDVVMNHTDGWRQAPLACFDGNCPNNTWGVYFFGPGPYATTPWGPRPNYAEPRVSELLLGSVRQWLTEYRGDGFRFDSVSNIRALDGSGSTPGGKELLVNANALAHQARALSIAEDLKGDDAITAPSSAGGFGFDSQWDGFAYDVPNLLVPADDNGRDLGMVEGQLKGGFAGDPFARLMSLENHDTVGNGSARLPVRIDGANPESFAARRRSMVGAVLLLTTPGVPMLFMGEERLATTGFTDPPLPLPDATARGAEVRAFFKDLIALRRSLTGLQHTQVQILHRNDTNKVIAYQRGDTVVVLNLRNQAYPRYDFGVPKGGTWRVRLDSDWKQYGSDFGGGQTGPIEALNQPRDGSPYTLPVQLGAYGALVLTP
jgi:1,4-alpha-glucan branching enzyme